MDREAVAPQDTAAAREATLRCFKVAFENMAQGVCSFDGAHRLIMSNRRYAELYDLPPESLPPGTTLREVIDLRVTVGSCPCMPLDQYLAWRNGIANLNAPSETVVEMTNGRTIVIKHQPMPDGGWVATHEDVTDQRRAAARIAHLAHHDALTGLPNRILFHERLDAAFAPDGTAAGANPPGAGARPGSGRNFAVLCIDLDRFKEVNDTFGHPVGDQLLVAVTGRLLGAAREGDTIARLGGDEFAIIQGGVSGPREVARLARRVLDALTRPFELGGHRVLIGGSIGIAMAPADGADTDALLRHADIALYRAKADGRGCWRFFESAMNLRMQVRRTLEQDLQRALEQNEFELAFQPWVSVPGRQAIGLEALLRWRHPERGLVGPDAFVPLAEETGLILPIGEWALRNACAAIAALPFTVQLSVNLSPVQFLRHGLRAAVDGALTASGLSPDRLELEITERVMLQDTEATLATLHRLRALGVGIAMDDFGTGYSSLAALQRFPFTKVKVDRRFVDRLGCSPQATAIVRAIADLSRALGMRTTAEGVETETQFAALAGCGCTEAQGYLFGRPAPFDAIGAVLGSLAAERRVETVPG